LDSNIMDTLFETENQWIVKLKYRNNNLTLLWL
jgi:hypothetical protein